MSLEAAHPLIPDAYDRASPHKRWSGHGLHPDPLVRVFGLRRSGNHAVIDWLLRNAPTPSTVFLNCCEARADPFVSATHDIRRQDGKRVDEVTSATTMIISYEDTKPRPGTGMTAGIIDRKFDHELIVYRSFLNWAASLTRKVSANEGYSPWEIMQTLCAACRAYDGVLEYIQSSNSGTSLPVCYDAWFTDEAYRIAILTRLGWPQKDAGLGDVQKYGGGSSFGDTGQAVDLSVTNRWMQMATDETFLILMRLAAQDQNFMTRLEAAFPEDAVRVKALDGDDIKKET